MEYVVAAMIQCSEPRLPFLKFYDRVYHGRYPGEPYEEKSSAMVRVMEAVAAYVDYAEQYRDKCHERR